MLSSAQKYTRAAHLHDGAYLVLHHLRRGRRAVVFLATVWTIEAAKGTGFHAGPWVGPRGAGPRESDATINRIGDHAFRVQFAAQRVRLPADADEVIRAEEFKSLLCVEGHEFHNFTGIGRGSYEREPMNSEFFRPSAVAGAGRRFFQGSASSSCPASRKSMASS